MSEQLVHAMNVTGALILVAALGAGLVGYLLRWWL